MMEFVEATLLKKSLVERFSRLGLSGQVSTEMCNIGAGLARPVKKQV